MSRVNDTDIRAIVSAAREATHAAANVATIAASTHGRHDGGREALDASIAAARAAFVLDDIYRRHNGSEESLRSALESLAAAEAALGAARRSLANASVSSLRVGTSS